MSDEHVHTAEEAKAAESNQSRSNTTQKPLNPKSEAKPTIAKATNKQNVRHVLVSCGQGGASIAQVLKASLPNSTMIAINTSNQDLDMVNIPAELKFKIGGETANGAGKNRNRAKQYFKNFAATNTYTKEKLGAIDTFIGYYEELLFHPTQQTIIIVCFSSDGGSGSGLGPMLVATLSNCVNSAKSFTYNNNEYVIDDVSNLIPRPVVVGLTPKCAIKSGATNLQNTIECFLDIQNSIDRGLGHFFIADNNLPSSVKYNSTEEMFRIINARIAMPFVKFLGIEMNSSIKCMDLQDKINTLRISGCSTFVSITEENQYQYVSPHGQSITRTVLMLDQAANENGAAEKAASRLMKDLDVTSVDVTSVFFDLEKMGITTDLNKELLETSMIGFFGFRSLNAIVEDLRDNLHRIQSANDKKMEMIFDQSAGFDSIKEDSEKLNSRFSSATLDHNSVLDIF